MLRKVNSIWHLVARTIYPDLTDYISEGQQNSEQKKSWGSAFHLERHLARGCILGFRNPHGYSDKPTVRYILDIHKAFPATFDIQVEAMKALQWRLENIDARDKHKMDTEGGLYATTLYSTLSRHVLRTGPYAAVDVENEIKEHSITTPRTTIVQHLGALILVILDEFYHYRPSSIAVLVGTLQVLTLGETPR